MSEKNKFRNDRPVVRARPKAKPEPSIESRIRNRPELQTRRDELRREQLLKMAPPGAFAANAPHPDAARLTESGVIPGDLAIAPPPGWSVTLRHRDGSERVVSFGVLSRTIEEVVGNEYDNRRYYEVVSADQDARSALAIEYLPLVGAPAEAAQGRPAQASDGGGAATDDQGLSVTIVGDPSGDAAAAVAPVVEDAGLGVVGGSGEPEPSEGDGAEITLKAPGSGEYSIPVADVDEVVVKDE